MATTATSALSSSTSAALASSPAALAAANKASAQKLITSLSAGSGVDVSALAQNLVDAERAPQENAIKAKITKNESRISGYSALSFVLDSVKTALTGLKDQNSFSSLVANNTNTSAFSVTAAATAVEGSHNVNVLQLAKAQRTVTEGLASPTASLNGGKAITFSLTVGGTSSDIKLPDGYSIEFGGQFKNLQEARARLAVVVPVALALIFILVFMALGRREGRIDVAAAMDGEDERSRSMASVRRARERERRQAELVRLRAGQERVVRDVVIPETISVQELANRMAARGGGPARPRRRARPGRPAAGRGAACRPACPGVRPDS